ncbi:universal stress protein [Cellulophaga sp. Hel_I_12]|uniref:universal stress protein n=1 Tax=Cellulophaga sp. Hel_I_12 TaxID=1249972 RepID=UPI0006485FDE|nr:universal stress protein [Cellulophaga sp. Hel_I_12]
MKNILVTTDFSNDAYAALFYSTQLLAAKSCTFYILNVFDKLTPLEEKKTSLFGDKKLLKLLEISSKEKLLHVLHKINLDTDNPIHSFETISKKGTLTKILKKIIHYHAIDFVVMGNKGNTSAKDLFMGSNTVQVANSINLCPILAVPKQINFKTLKEIAFITNFKKGCGEKNIAPLRFIASLSNANIRVMHINENEILDAEQELKRKLLENCLKEYSYSFHWIQNFSAKAQVIDAF